ncbi:MAG TPA: D-glycerate dehydrogenase [Candidatus Desulfobacillus sp.]|nr:D-glycerate dehydrogenase [Candidatus Desulfobacillus sp.]
MKVAVTRQIFEEVLEELRGHFEVDANQEDLPLEGAALAARLADKDGALILASDRIDAALVAACPRLKAVCNIGVGYNNIDVAACSAAGILVTNTPEVLNDTTADLAFALVLAAGRQLVRGDRYIREGRWQRWRFMEWLGPDVHHATLGILGMGRIGQAVARRARGFDMNILYHNRTRLPAQAEAECGTAYVGKEELLRRADYLVLLLPYSAETHHCIGAAELALMKPGAWLINIARGGIVDDAALIDCLRREAIGGAALDVFENEPRLDPRFIDLDNVVLTPHIGGASRDTRLNMARLAAQNLVAALGGAPPPNLLNPEARRA